jgi:hypothetical protein
MGAVEWLLVGLGFALGCVLCVGCFLLGRIGSGE